MQELNMLEVDAVGGGIFPLIAIGIALLLSGCGAKKDIEEREKKQQEEADRQSQ